MPRAKRSLLDRLLFLGFLSGFGLLAFLSGASVVKYQIPPYAPLNQAFNDIGAELELFHDSMQVHLNQRIIEYVLAHGDVKWNKQEAYNGYTMLTIHLSQDAYLLDMEGHIVHRWHMPFSKAWPHPPHIKNPVADSSISMTKAAVFPNGDLLTVYTAEGDPMYGYGMVKMDKDSNVLWAYDQHAHHGFDIDPANGNIYGLIQNFITEPQPGYETLPYPMLADSIVILSPDGKELKRISILDAFRGTPYELLLHHHYDEEDPKWDFLHTNSVMKLEPEMAAAFPMFKPGQLLVSMRNINTVAVVDPDSGKVVWATQGAWRGQHCASLLPNGHILLLDNKGDDTGDKPYSRVIEFDPATLAVAWHFDGSPQQPFYTDILGQAQRLPNGNTLINDSLNLHIFEVTPDKEIVWEDKMPRPDAKLKKALRTDEENSISSVLYEGSIATTHAIRYRADDLPFLKELPVPDAPK